MKNTKQKHPFFRIPGGVVNEAIEWFGSSAEEIEKEEGGPWVVEDDVLSPQAERNQATQRQWLKRQDGPERNRTMYWKKKGLPEPKY